MKKLNIGDKVRVIDVDAIAGGKGHYYNGMETEVVKMRDDGRPYLRDKYGEQGVYISHGELHAIELIETKLTIEQRVIDLENKVVELERKLVEKEVKNHDIKFNVSFGKVEVQNKNEERKVIIEKAETFVEDVSEMMKEFGHGNELGKYGKITSLAYCYMLKAKFIVNKEKRTVVALLSPYFVSNICSKGIAKCDPDDVFNEHIGKAIALGRALGLDVTEFENSVQPDEVVLGMEVASLKDYLKALGGAIHKGDVFTVVENLENLKTQCCIGSAIAEDSKIVNDTNAKY